MSTIKLYPHQEDIINSVRAEMSKHKSVLIQAATGIGKSVMAAYMIKASQLKGKKSIFVVPRKQLVDQMADTFDSFEINYSYIAAGRNCNPYAPTHICTVGTLANRLDKVAPDLVFIDETHIGGVQLDKVIKHYQESGAWVIGLSATPSRLDGRGLGMWYFSMVKGVGMGWLIENGFLSDYEIYCPPNDLDFSKIKSTAGDFAKKELNDYMDRKTAIMGDAVKHYKDLAYGKLTIAFCPSLHYAKTMCELFNVSGIPSGYVDGECSIAERRTVTRQLGNKEIFVIFNVGLCSTGYDLSAASGMDITVECVIDLAATQSLALQLQKNGRALRKKDFPAIIIDHVGNTNRHGLPCQERDWTLEDTKKKKKGEKSSIELKNCPSCFYRHKPSLICPKCGFIYDIISRQVEEIEGELIKVDKEKIKQQIKVARGKARTLEELIEFGQGQGYKNPSGWARHILKARNGYRKR